MATVLERLLIVFCTVTAGFATLMLLKDNRKSVENRIFSYYCMGSSIWSLFFGELIAQTDEEVAYLCRCIGMVGTFTYLISITFLLIKWSRIQGWLKHYILFFSLLGIVIYPFNIRRSSIIFHTTKVGMSYEFVKDFWSSFYSWYSIILSVNLLIMIISMIRKGNKKRVRKMGHSLIVSLIVIFSGSIFDTVLPSFGFAAFPGSTITQFLGTVVVFRVLLYYNKSSITVKNMSGFIYRSIKTAILVYNDRNELMIVSEGARELLGINEKANRNTRLSDMFAISEDVLDSGEAKKTIAAECRIRSLSCSIEINRLHDEYMDVIGYITVVNDVTEREHFIQALDNERKRANDANDAKSSFLANMSHEIRTPINTVLGMNEMILRESTAEPILKYAENIHGASEALLSIINDILDFSKVEAGRMEIISAEYELTNMLKSIINMFMLKSEEKGLELMLDIAEDAPERLYGDEMRLRQVLTNLLSNAVKYTEKGSVTFKLRWERQDEAASLTFDVIDTGIGIRDEDLEMLFRSFTRLDQKTNHHIEGTGLGLSIASNLVELMGGKLEVESTYGKGSVFRCIIAQKIICDNGIGDISEILGPVENSLGKYFVSFTAPEAKVLVVDDNVMNLEVIKGLLKKTRIQIDTVTNGMACLDMVTMKDYNIILLDHMMPHMDGIETFKHLRSMQNNKSSAAAVIVLTANAIYGSKEAYLKEGFDDYLSKPVAGKPLESMICKYLPEELVSKTLNTHAANSQKQSTAELAAQMKEHGIDLEKGLSYCDTLEIYRSTARVFIMSSDELISQLNRFRSIKDSVNYRVVIHSIKSNAKTLGREDLYELALKQENCCASGDFQAVLDAGSKPEQLIKELIAGLDLCFKKECGASQSVEDNQEEIAYSSDVTPDSESYAAVPPDEAELWSRIDEIAELLDDYEDMSALEKLKELLVVSKYFPDSSAEAPVSDDGSQQADHTDEGFGRPISDICSQENILKIIRLIELYKYDEAAALLRH